MHGDLYRCHKRVSIGEHPVFDGAPGNYSVSLSAEPYRVTLALADFGGNPQVTFDGWGLPDSGGTIAVKLGSQQRTVTVDSETGRVNLE